MPITSTTYLYKIHYEQDFLKHAILLQGVAIAEREEKTLNSSYLETCGSELEQAEFIIHWSSWMSCPSKREEWQGLTKLRIGPYINLLLWSSVASHERSCIAATSIYLMSWDFNCITSLFGCINLHDKCPSRTSVIIE